MSEEASTTETLAEMLRRLIVETGKPLNRVAREAGIVQPVLYAFLHENADMRLTTAQKLIDYFGMEVRQRKARH